jgi:hypothetical protein
LSVRLDAHPSRNFICHTCSRTAPPLARGTAQYIVSHRDRHTRPGSKLPACPRRRSAPHPRPQLGAPAVKSRLHFCPLENRLMLANLKVAIKGLRRATADSLAHPGDMHEQLHSLFTQSTQISRGNLFRGPARRTDLSPCGPRWKCCQRRRWRRAYRSLLTARTARVGRFSSTASPFES